MWKWRVDINGMEENAHIVLVALLWEPELLTRVWNRLELGEDILVSKIDTLNSVSSYNMTYIGYPGQSWVHVRTESC